MINKAQYVVSYERIDPNGHPLEAPRPFAQSFRALLPALALYTRLKEEDADRLKLSVVIDISP